MKFSELLYWLCVCVCVCVCVYVCVCVCVWVGGYECAPVYVFMGPFLMTYNAIMPQANHAEAGQQTE